MVRSLTGIRGIASLWVLAFHVAELTHLRLTGIPHALVSRGYLGVDIFFALSGFVLCHSNRDGHLSSLSSISLFYSRRAIRIFPPHLVAMLLVVAAVCFVPGFKALRADDFYSWSTLPANILLIQTWTIHSAGWNGPAWSLSAELLGYIIFPVIFYFVRRLSKNLSILLLTIWLVAGVAMFVYLGGDQLAKAGMTGTLRMAISLTAGMIAYNVRSRFPKALIIMAAAAFVTAMAVPTLQALTLICTPLVMIALISSGDGSLARLLASRPIYWLGTVSFSLYIVQWATIGISVAILPHGTAQVVGALASTIAMTYLFFICVERPSITWTRSLGHKPKVA